MAPHLPLAKKLLARKPLPKTLCSGKFRKGMCCRRMSERLSLQEGVSSKDALGRKFVL